MKIKYLSFGFIIGAYMYTLILDISSGFNFKGFIFGTGVLIISLIVINFVFKEEKDAEHNKEVKENDE